jgi:hypothetical protein
MYVEQYMRSGSLRLDPADFIEEFPTGSREKILIVGTNSD